MILTPYMLWSVLPKCAPQIVEFVANNLVEVAGVGHVCSMAAFDLQRHGNVKYGGRPTNQESGSLVDLRSCQGKVEKSLLTFVATYPTWEPTPDCKAMLRAMTRWEEVVRDAFPCEAVLSLAILMFPAGMQRARQSPLFTEAGSGTAPALEISACIRQAPFIPLQACTAQRTFRGARCSRDRI